MYVDSTVGCLFVEEVGKPKNLSAMGYDGLTPWSAGGGLMVPAPRGPTHLGGGGFQDGQDPHPDLRPKGGRWIIFLGAPTYLVKIRLGSVKK